ncbi:MAG: MerC domain-containing protein [Gammaproteobacteria bacterium]|nr:MerC domain-containing protein [Gammaproteobacteria bacterium]
MPGATVVMDETFHTILLWVILPTSVIAAGMGCVRHRDASVLMLVGTGLSVLIGAAFWAHGHAPGWVDISLSLVGGTLLAAGHIGNFLLCRKYQVLMCW